MAIIFRKILYLSVQITMLLHLQTCTDFNLIQSHQKLNTLLIHTAELTLLSLIIPKPLLKGPSMDL